MNIAHNVGGMDKTMRMALGIGGAAYALLGRGTPGRKAAAGAVSAIALTTALAEYCPMNAMMGIDTSGKQGS